MPNPMFNESTFNESTTRRSAGNWPAPQPGTSTPSAGGARPAPPVTGGPITDGAVSPWQRATLPHEQMTVNGTISATSVLFVLLLITAAIGWTATDSIDFDRPDAGFSIPMLAWVGLGIGFAAVIALYFRPHLARILGPVYAIAQGFFVGAISKAYETFYEGIVLQAAAATIAVFFVMLGLYRTRIIKVTDRFRRIVIGATLAILVLYGVSLLVMLFGGDVSFLRSPDLFGVPFLGIGFSVLVCGIAAMNLALDFDLIERGTSEGAPKAYEWYAAFGLLVTIIWLYLELLRLLAKLRR